MIHTGAVRKLAVRGTDPVDYTLPVGDTPISLNPLLERKLQLVWTGEIRCIHCGRSTKKSFGQGHCYPCFTRLAQCDSCVFKPELCHYDRGTCREPEWGEAHCLIAHTVYLANSSGLKIGITRGLDATTRWIDQGAAEARAIRTVPSRLEAGILEVAFKDHVADKTNWRKMLRGEPEPVDLDAERDRLFDALAAARPGFTIPGDDPAESGITSIRYPVIAYPSKLSSHNLEKQPKVEGTLQGIKGQYLMLDTGVLNIRKYGGYVLRVEWN
jgi:hypothetical protein